MNSTPEVQKLLIPEGEPHEFKIPLRLPSNLPEEHLYSYALKDTPGANIRHRTLGRTFWLHNNGIYGSAALLQYIPRLGRLMNDTWIHLWNDSPVFANVCKDSIADYVIGKLPIFDTASTSIPAHCQYPDLADDERFKAYQYPAPSGPCFDSIDPYQTDPNHPDCQIEGSEPILGMDHQAKVADGSIDYDVVSINDNNPRDLFKYGCLRQMLKGKRHVAANFLKKAMDRFDGHGFLDASNEPGKNKEGIYNTRNIAYALMCANALGWGDRAEYPTTTPGVFVSKQSLEDQLWAIQHDLGGVWTNTCKFEYDQQGNPLPSNIAKCNDADSDTTNSYGIANSAKLTNEISYLILLAYGKNIWDAANTPQGSCQ